MVQVYQTEDEQVEELKKWFRENGRALASGLLLAAALVFAGFTWQQRQQHQAEAASAQYQALIQGLRQLEMTQTPEALKTANFLADTLKKDFSSTVYAQFAALFKARLAVQGNDLGAAETELRWVLDHKPADEIKALTQLRLARVLYAKGDSKAAVALLDGLSSGAYAASAEQLKGDIANASGDFDGARSAYQKAQELEQKQANPVNDPALEMKLRDLSQELPPAAGAATGASSTDHE
jgi:predicted negative regulator of RcsB-dependent stress response